jgi:hypothetical protein
MAQLHPEFRNTPNRRYCIGGSNAPIIMDNDQTIPRLWHEKRRPVERGDRLGNLNVPLGVATEDLNQRWYEAIIGRMPAGSYVLAVCYATAVIYLAWLPWNVLLILLPFLCRSKLSPFGGLDVTSSSRCGVLSGRGSAV